MPPPELGTAAVSTTTRAEEQDHHHQDLRGAGYHSEDFSLVKNTRITDGTGIQFRAEFFNVFNWNILTASGYYGRQQAFDIDVASPTFWQWTGSVSNPRNIQLSLQVLF